MTRSRRSSRRGSSRRQRARDPRPPLLSIIGLLFLLLPFLLFTTSPQQLGGLHLLVPSSGDELPPTPPGTIEALMVHVDAREIVVEAELKRTDVRASIGEVERYSEIITRSGGDLDLGALQRVMRRLKRQDAGRERVTLVPSDESTTGELVSLMDALRRDASGPLFSEVALGEQQEASE